MRLHHQILLLMAYYPCIAIATLTNYPGRDCENAIPLEFADEDSKFVTTIGTVDPFEFFTNYDACSDEEHRGLWYEFVGNGSPFFISTCGMETSYPTKISVLTSDNQGCGSDVLECYNDEAGSSCRTNENASDVLVHTEKDMTYYVYVRPNGDPGDGTLPGEGGTFRLFLYQIDLEDTQIPKAFNALNYQVADEVDTSINGETCMAGNPDFGSQYGPDAQVTLSDQKCKDLGPCHLAFVRSDEVVRYYFTHDEDDVITYQGQRSVVVDIIVRAASLRDDRIMLLEVFSGTEQEEGQSVRFNAPGRGYQEFRDMKWQNVVLNPEESFHQLVITFESSNINVCSITVELSDVVDEDQDDDDDDDNDDLPYIPLALNALSYNDAKEIDEGIFGNCDAGAPPGGVNAPDAQNTMDEFCRQLGPCHIAFTRSSEYVVYNFKHPEEYEIMLGEGGPSVFVDITIRVASIRSSNMVRMEVSDGNEFVAAEDFGTPGLGYEEFRDVTWRYVELQASEPVHSLLVGFSNSNINLCSVSIVPSSTPSVTWTALEYFDSDGFITVGRQDERTCVVRDDTEDRVTLAAGYLQYQFFVDSDSSQMDHGVIVRGRSLNDGGRLRIVVYPTASDPIMARFDLPADSDDAVWQDYILESVSLPEDSYVLRIFVDRDGLMELCSVAVKPIGERFVVTAPGTFSALMYTDYRELSDRRFGNCPDGRPFDAQETNDAECANVESVYDFTCNVGWSQPGEFVVYQFITEEEQETADISVRIASNQRSRRVQLEIMDTNESMILNGPGRGFQSFDTRTWRNVKIGPGRMYSLKVTFLDGNVNMCSFKVSY